MNSYLIDIQIFITLSPNVEKASAVLAENFDAVQWTHNGDDELNFLPFDVFVDILDNRALTLDTEYRVYKVIANYVKGTYDAQSVLMG